MSETVERQIVMSTPGFPVSSDDADKPFLLNHARALVEAGFRVTVICPALPHLSGRQRVEGIDVVRVRYAPRRLEEQRHSLRPLVDSRRFSRRCFGFYCGLFESGSCARI